MATGHECIGHCVTKSRSGRPVAAATFRSDMNEDSSINAADVSFVKSLAGTGLP